MKIAKCILRILTLLIAAVTVFLFEADLPAKTVDAKYTNSESKFLTMENGSRVHYRDQGNPTGLPVVLVHGAMASLHTWEPWVNILGQKYRIITLDLPGHGLAGQLATNQYQRRYKQNWPCGFRLTAARLVSRYRPLFGPSTADRPRAAFRLQ